MDQEALVSLDEIQDGECLDYVERPRSILEGGVKVLQDKEVPLVRVQWEHQRGSEWTWEPKAEMWEHDPRMFTAVDFEDKV